MYWMKLIDSFPFLLSAGLLLWLLISLALFFRSAEVKRVTDGYDWMSLVMCVLLIAAGFTLVLNDAQKPYYLSMATGLGFMLAGYESLRNLQAKILKRKIRMLQLDIKKIATGNYGK